MATEDADVLRERRNRIFNDLDNTHWAVEKRRDEEEPLVGNFRTLHRDWYSMANLSLLLGDIERARREFATAGLYTRALRAEYIARWNDLEKSRRFAAGSNLRWGIYMAILSGSQRLIDTVGADLVTMSDDFKTEYGFEGESGSSWSYWQACTIASLCRGDDDAARAYLERYQQDSDARQTELLAAIHDALLADDVATTRDALHQMAAEHEDIFGESRSWKAIFSHATAVHLLIARHRGMTITAAELDHEYLPAALDEYDIGDPIDLPSPEYVDDELLIR